MPRNGISTLRYFGSATTPAGKHTLHSFEALRVDECLVIPSVGFIAPAENPNVCGIAKHAVHIGGAKALAELLTNLSCKGSDGKSARRKKPKHPLHNFRSIRVTEPSPRT